MAWPVVAAVVLGGGCANPDAAVGFDEPDPDARFRAIRQAAAENDRSAIPELIDLLASDDPAERLLAIRSLEKLTGTTHGYDHAALPKVRQEAIQRWADWYKANPDSNPTENRPIDNPGT